MTTAVAKPEGGPGSLFIFDAYNFIFRAYHALPMLNAPDGTPVNAVHGFARMVQAVRREFAPESMVAVFDAGGDGERRALFPEYKGNRPPPPDDLVPQFALVREATDALGIARVEDSAYEADDIIASYVRKARAQGLRCVIVSSDKDLMQLVDLGEPAPVLLWDTMKNKAIGPAEVEAKFGVPPRLLGDLLALTGDSSDNIPGVPGIGVKTAAQLLHDHGDLAGVLAAGPTLKQKKRSQNLVTHADDARLSRRLVTLHDAVPLPTPVDHLRDHGPDEQRLAGFFEPLGFKRVLQEARSIERGRRGATQVGEDVGVVELAPVEGFNSHRDDVHVLTPHAGLSELAQTLATAPRVGVYAVRQGADPLRTELVGLAFAVPGAEAPELVYVPLRKPQGELLAEEGFALETVIARLGPSLAAGRHLVVYDAKATSHALAAQTPGLAEAELDPMLVSYTLDPARTSHALEALASDVLGYECMRQESVTGKGRKAVALAHVDTASLARFASERAEVTLALGEALRAQLQASDVMQRLYETLERPLCGVLTRMEARGIQVDVAVLQAQSEALTATIADLRAGVEREAGHPVNLDSPIQLQKLLFDERGLPATRKTKTGFSTDAQALEELKLLDPIVASILEYRQLTKLKGTYLDALPSLVRPGTGRLHTSYHQAVAATGRLSSSDPNLQNIPIRRPEGRRIREAFVAPAGHELVALDYSQIELRVLAHLCGDDNLVSAFVDDVDVHRRTAAEVFAVPESEVDGEQRRIAKAVNFGVIYGQTPHGLGQQLGIPRGKAGSYINAYFEKYPGVKRYMDELIVRARHYGFAETILGRRRRIPELQSGGRLRGQGERMARNTPIQGSAADILKLAMIRVDRALADVTWARMLLTVHDELIFECEQGRVDELIALCRPLMEEAVSLRVSLRVDAGHGPTWAACKG